MDRNEFHKILARASLPEEALEFVVPELLRGPNGANDPGLQHRQTEEFAARLHVVGGVKLHVCLALHVPEQLDAASAHGRWERGEDVPAWVGGWVGGGG